MCRVRGRGRGRRGPQRVLRYGSWFQFSCAARAPAGIFFRAHSEETIMTQALDGRRPGTEDVGRSRAQAFAPAAPSSSLPDLERELATVRLPLEEATTLPGRLYHDPEIHRRELRDIFSRMWLCVGREEDVGRPGDFLTRTVGPESVIVVRD